MANVANRVIAIPVGGLVEVRHGGEDRRRLPVREGRGSKRRHPVEGYEGEGPSRKKRSVSLGPQVVMNAFSNIAHWRYMVMAGKAGFMAFAGIELRCMWGMLRRVENADAMHAQDWLFRACARALASEEVKRKAFAGDAENRRMYLESCARVCSKYKCMRLLPYIKGQLEGALDVEVLRDVGIFSLQFKFPEEDDKGLSKECGFLAAAIRHIAHEDRWNENENELIRQLRAFYKYDNSVPEAVAEVAGIMLAIAKG